MTQTAKAQQNQANQKESQEQNQAPSMEELTKLLSPLVETVAQLKADKEQVALNQAEAQEAAQQAKLNKDADIAGMLEEANLSETGGDDKYENLSKRQLVEVLTGAMETALEANATKIKVDIAKSLSEDNKKVDVIEKTVMAILGKMGVAESRGKHEDFDDHKDAISNIMGEIPGITFERAYLLAKSEKAGELPPKGQIDTEKPDNQTWSPQGGALPNQNALQTIADRGRLSREDSTATKNGTVGIRNIIDAGVNKAVDDLFAGQQRD